MKILFLSDNFPPEVNAPATRTYEHCAEWVKSGAEVTVITCFPNFPQGEIYAGYKNKLKSIEYIDGIKVIRVWSYMAANKGFMKRTLDFLSYAMMAAMYGLFEKTDVIVATSPQFFTTWAGWFLSKLKRKPWIFELRDLWPESIATVGAMHQDSKLYTFLEKIELGLYKSADMVIPNTDAFKANLVSRGIDKKKVKVIPNGANLELYKSNYLKSSLKEDLGINEKFVFGYIGTHGLAHSLEFIIKAVSRNELVGSHFLFIGDGAEKSNLVSMAQKLELTNVTFLDSVPKEQIPAYLSIIDAALVPLKKSETFKTVIPSKIFEAVAMGKPILLGVEGQALELVSKYEVGYGFEPENEQDFIDKALQLSMDVKNYPQLSRNALNMAKAYDRKVLAAKMLNLISTVRSLTVKENSKIKSKEIAGD